MATNTKLVLTFRDEDGEKLNKSFNYIDPEIEAASVKALMQGMIANGTIFDRQPASMSSAKLVETTETQINIDI